MIKNKVNINRKTVIISVVLALVVLSGTVFASGILNGTLLDEPKLVPAQKETDSTVSNDLERKTNTEVTQSETETNTSSDIVLKEINIDESLASPCEGQISMTFGRRENPVTKEVIEHNGIDIAAPEGTEVVSSITGTVTDVGFDSDKGNYVVVERDNVKTIYSQLATTEVRKGDSVTSRQTIGTVGKTGRSTGAHLHFEVIVDGEYLDPEGLIK